MRRDLTPEEAKALAALHRLSKIWPRSLTIFGWSGSLVVMDSEMERGPDAVIDDDFPGIPCDGGDPA